MLRYRGIVNLRRIFSHISAFITCLENERPYRSDLQPWLAWRITRSCLTGQDHRTTISSTGYLIIRRHMTLADRKDTRKDRPSPAGRPDRRTSNEERANPVLQRSNWDLIFIFDVLFRCNLIKKFSTVKKYCGQAKKKFIVSLIKLPLFLRHLINLFYYIVILFY